MTKRTYHHGYTLVELAIALVVIGLLLAGIVKGQELVANTRINMMIQDLRKLEAGVRQFRETYGALPGDLPNPGSRLRNCGPPICNTSETSNGDGLVESAEESRKFWHHLGVTGLIDHVDFTQTNYMYAAPRNPLKGYNVVWFNSDPSTLDGNLYTLADNVSNWSRMRLMNVILMDNKMDDGKPNTGELRVMATPQCNVSGENAYIIGPKDVECSLITRVRGGE